MARAPMPQGQKAARLSALAKPTRGPCRENVKMVVAHATQATPIPRTCGVLGSHALLQAAAAAALTLFVVLC